MSTSKFTEAWLKSKIRKIQTDIVDELALRIETGARRNFNKAVNEVSTDDPVVTVARTKTVKEAIPLLVVVGKCYSLSLV